MTAISRSKVSIYIVDADTAISSLAATDVITGEIKSYSKSGGEKDVESDPLFGGFVDKEKPISQFELSLDIVPSVGADASLFDEMAYAVQTVSSKTVYTSSSATAYQPSDKMVVIYATDGTTHKTLAYNNCNVTVLDIEHNADDNRTYNMTLKLAPETSEGKPNFMTGNLAATAMPEWSTLI